MKEPKFNVNDVLLIANYYDGTFVAVVDEIRITRNGIIYLVKNNFGDNDLTNGLCVFLPDEYEDNCEGEPSYTIVDKVGHIKAYREND